MTAEQGFQLHPGAAQDITEIWEFIAEDNPLAAGRMREDIVDAIEALCISQPGPYADRSDVAVGSLSDHTRLPTEFRII